MCKRDQARAQVEAGIKDGEFVILKPYVLCRLEADLNNRHYYAVTHAIQSPSDTWNEKRGMEIARGRAILQIAKRANLI
jgi:hypothetical protein